MVVPGTGDLLVATGNAKFDGRTNWGDSALMLSPDASRLLQNWTPTDQATLNATDGDLGTTVPAVLSSRLAVQGGKDGKLRLLSLARMNGKGGHSAKTGGELQTLPLSAGLFTAPAVWKGWVFCGTFSGTQAFRLVGSRLRQAWSNGTAGHEPGRRRRPALRLRPGRRAERLSADDGRALRAAAGRQRALEQPDRHRRADRAARGERK